MRAWPLLLLSDWPAGLGETLWLLLLLLLLFAGPVAQQENKT